MPCLSRARPAGHDRATPTTAGRPLGGRLRLRRGGAGGAGPAQVPQLEVHPAGPGRRAGRAVGSGVPRPDRRRHLAAHDCRPARGPGLRPGGASRPGDRPGPGRSRPVLPRPAGRPVPDRALGGGAPSGAGLRGRSGSRAPGAGGRRRGHHRRHPGGRSRGTSLSRGEMGRRGHGGPNAAPGDTAPDERCGSVAPGSRAFPGPPRPIAEPRFRLRAGTPREERKKSRWTAPTP